MTTSTPCAAQVAHRLDDLVVRLAEADDEPGLRQHGVVRDLLFRMGEEPERLVVVHLRAAHLPVQASDGLDVVVEDIWSLGEHDLERFSSWPRNSGVRISIEAPGTFVFSAPIVAA